MGHLVVTSGHIQISCGFDFIAKFVPNPMVKFLPHFL